MQPIVNYFKYPNRLLLGLIKKTYFLYSDSLFLRMRFRLEYGKKLHLKEPKRYNEKLQWLKLYDRNPEYTQMVDKVLAKSFVSKRIGSQYVIPCLGVWESFDEIDFNKLPNQFVLKTNHSGGNTGVVICKDKSTFDRVHAKEKLNASLRINPYILSKEWPYKNIHKRIFAEEYKVDETTGELRDYKFFCFNGKVKGLFVGTERQKVGTDVKFDFFDENYNHLPIMQGHENAQVIPEKPITFDLMKTLAEQLSKDIPHVRVDLYEANGSVYFGEMTFYHFSGLVSFVPDEWDYRIGDLIDLSLVKQD